MAVVTFGPVKIIKLLSFLWTTMLSDGDCNMYDCATIYMIYLCDVQICSLILQQSFFLNFSVSMKIEKKAMKKSSISLIIFPSTNVQY